MKKRKDWKEWKPKICWIYSYSLIHFIFAKHDKYNFRHETGKKNACKYLFSRCVSASSESKTVWVIPKRWVFVNPKLGGWPSSCVKSDASLWVTLTSILSRIHRFHCCIRSLFPQWSLRELWQSWLTTYKCSFKIEISVESGDSILCYSLCLCLFHSCFSRLLGVFCTKSVKDSFRCCPE